MKRTRKSKKSQLMSQANEDNSVKFQTFYRCHDLQHVTLPGNFTAIGDEAFFECSSMSRIDLPSRIQNIGSNSFKNCYSLEEVKTDAKIDNIGASAFYDCSSLTSFSRFSDTDNSKSFTTVGDHAFCKSGLTSANLALNLGYGDAWFGNYSFASCNNLQNVSFLKSTAMGNHMFEGCSSLTSFDVSEATNINNYVGNYVFKDCSKLDHASLSKHQFSILEGFFDGCKSMRYFDFFDGYTYDEGDDAQFQYIKKFAFNGCSRLTSIQLPESITTTESIEDGALSGCSQLREVNFHGIDSKELFDDTVPGFDEDIIYGKAYSFATIAGETRGMSTFNAIYDAIGENEHVVIIIDQSWRDCIVGCDDDWTDHLASNLNTDHPTQDIESTSKRRRGIVFYIEDVIGTHEYNDDFQPSNRPYTDEEMKTIRANSYDIRAKLFDSKSYNNDFLLNVMDKIKYPNGNFRISKTVMKNILTDNSKQAYAIEFKKGTDSSSTKYTVNATSIGSFIESNLPGPQEEYKVYKRKFTPIDNMLIATGFYRACKDISVWTKDHQPEQSRTYPYEWNSPYVFPYNRSEVVPYVPKYEFESDRTTKSNFKTAKQIADLHPGQDVTKYSCWYYNAKEIFEEAQRTQKPLLLIYSMTTCTPCQMYGNYVHSDVEFQRWIAKQDILMCRLETPFVKALDPEYAYCEDEIAKKQMLNYHATDAESARSYNAFQERQFGLFKGSYQESEFTNPSFVFYWSKPDSNGQPTAFHGYSLHDLSKMVKVQTIGYDGIKRLIKSLCLYHFEGNDASSSTFVHDAPAFNKIDYRTPDPENPYYVEDGLITLNGWSAIKGNLTPTAAHDAIKDILSKHSSESHSYPDYIGGCLWIDYQEPEQLEWIALTYDTSILESRTTTFAQKIAELDKWKIFIGDKKYKLTLSESDYKDLYDGCSSEKSRMYRYSFVETT